MERVEVKIKLIDGGLLPEAKTEGAVCADCYARTPFEEEIVIPVGERRLIPLGFAMEIPDGYEAVIRPRSGLSSKGIDETVGTIDTDYRGEVKGCLVNNSKEDFVVHNGDRICQIAIRQVPKIMFTITDNLSETERGEGGFGSTKLR